MCVCVCDLGVVVSENFIQGLFFSIKRERERGTGQLLEHSNVRKNKLAKCEKLGKVLCCKKCGTF